MPELPEVETTRRGISPHLIQQRITNIKIRQPQLRWAIPSNCQKLLVGSSVVKVTRRAKYLILSCKQPNEPGSLPSWALIHLGMSGSLRICDTTQAASKHDHFDIELETGKLLRYRDPRRFGCLLCGNGDPYQHRLLHKLGPEPLSTTFNAEYLAKALYGRRCSIKTAIMQQAIVVGVGNIYASEALFLAGIHPKRAANRIAHARLARLVHCIKQTLEEAIAAGGTSLRDFSQADGKPGYFKQKLRVYGLDGHTCINCRHSIRMITLGQRSTYYCAKCQT